MRKYTKRSKEYPNAFKSYEYPELLEILLLREKGVKFAEISRQLGRTKLSVTNMYSFLTWLSRSFNNWEEAQPIMVARKLSVKSQTAIQRVWAEIKTHPETYFQEKKMTNGQATPKQATASVMEEALAQVDSLRVQLDEAIVNLVTVMVKEKTKDTVEAKNQEILELKKTITELKPLIEAAKQSNLVSSLRKVFRGN